MPSNWLEVGVNLLYLLNHHNYREVIFSLSTFWLGYVEIEIPKQDMLQAVWVVAESLGNVLSLSRTAWQDVASDNEPPHPTHHHLEDEDMVTEDWFTVILKLGDWGIHRR